jgi:hypothetical protein
MQLEPINLTALMATILGIMIVLIPVSGITSRFALSPTVEAFRKRFETKGAGDTIRILEPHLDLQEQKIAMLHQTVPSLSDGNEFSRQIAGPDDNG